MVVRVALSLLSSQQRENSKFSAATFGPLTWRPVDIKYDQVGLLPRLALTSPLFGENGKLLFKKKKTWVVVADGARSSVYVNNGQGTGLEVLSQSEPGSGRRPTRDLGTGKPGRGFATGGARHAFDDPVDWHQQEKMTFAREMAERINRAAEQKDFDRLVIAAPPKIMGELRGSLNRAAKEKLEAEVTKDLTNTPVPELPGFFKDILRL